MKIKTVVDEDFTNYKKPAMFIGTATCGGKCCIEAGIPLSVCQNDGWRSGAPIEFDEETLIKRYENNPLTSAIVFGGLEPFEQYEDVEHFIYKFRMRGNLDDVVIYTGYYPEEIKEQLRCLELFPNIVVKFGRYVPNRPNRYDDVLGVTLVSDNQFAERIS